MYIVVNGQSIHMPLQVASEVSVFEINIRFVGGLLSLYALTKDEVDLHHIIMYW